MSELPEEPPPPEPALMPRWVPVAIGVVLVTLAALAVFTGLRYRDDTLVGMVQSGRNAPRASAAPPGEPEPGASRMVSGNANMPSANEAVESEMRARRGMMVKASPNDAVVYVNDVPVGHARELDSEDEVYDFPAPGSYHVRIEAPAYEEKSFIVTVGENAERDIALIEVKLSDARRALPSPSSTR